MKQKCLGILGITCETILTLAGFAGFLMLVEVVQFLTKHGLTEITSWQTLIAKLAIGLVVIAAAATGIAFVYRTFPEIETISELRHKCISSMCVILVLLLLIPS